MVSNQRSFRKDKPKVVNVRMERSFRIITGLERRIMKKSISFALILVLGLIVKVAKGDFTFGTPINLGPTVNSASGDGIGCVSADGLEMYFDCNRSGGYGDWDIWVTRRPAKDDDWGAPENLGLPVNSSSYEVCACISADGLSLYFSSGRPGGYGGADIWVTKRQTRDDDWGQPENLGPIINSNAMENGSWISADGLELYFDSNRGDGFGNVDIWITKRATTEDEWGEPVNLGPAVNSSVGEIYPYVLFNGLLLLFSDVITGPMRIGGFGNVDMWMTTRASIDDPWGTPVNLGPIVNSSSIDSTPRISLDESMLYFSSERPGGLGGHYGDIYRAPIIPIVDLNGDGIVNAEDMCIIVDQWGESSSLCDIGPMPWGDGIVDVQDLIVLAEHLLKNVNDSTLIAHWSLDEAQDGIAYNSVSDSDGNLMGDPIWQPNGGMVAGALQLDGVDDYVSTDSVLNPADSVFSVLAWVKGGAQGQVVVSQQGAANWLTADAEGNLMTELKGSGRIGKPLQSQTSITDGNWHRIGLVWDGSKRTLYVDSIAVAEDTQDGLEGSDNGLYIGCGKNMEAGTYWLGLIDDIRIYNRAVQP
ncbi:MAG: LamG-like jellyroll fold domain-containing protein [Planctomycetota bacterium]|jgi:hypothetical protein